MTIAFVVNSTLPSSPGRISSRRIASSFRRAASTELGPSSSNRLCEAAEPSASIGPAVYRNGTKPPRLDCNTDPWQPINPHGAGRSTVAERPEDALERAAGRSRRQDRRNETSLRARADA
jgi:hypothetical protein